MKHLTWDEIYCCSACSALVPVVMRETHERWHDELFKALKQLRGLE